MVVLPLVPVTPMRSSRPDGCRYTQAATSPSRARGIGDHEHRQPAPPGARSRPRRVGEDGHGAGRGRVRAELGAVVLAAGQRRVQVAGPDPA